MLWGKTTLCQAEGRGKGGTRGQTREGARVGWGQREACTREGEERSKNGETRKNRNWAAAAEYKANTTKCRKMPEVGKQKLGWNKREKPHEWAEGWVPFSHLHLGPVDASCVIGGTVLQVGVGKVSINAKEAPPHPILALTVLQAGPNHPLNATPPRWHFPTMCPFSRGGNRGKERKRHLPRITHLELEPQRGSEPIFSFFDEGHGWVSQATHELSKSIQQFVNARAFPRNHPKAGAQGLPLAVSLPACPPPLGT